MPHLSSSAIGSVQEKGGAQFNMCGTKVSGERPPGVLIQGLLYSNRIITLARKVMTTLKTLSLNLWCRLTCCGLLWGGNRESGFEILGVVLYLRDCNNNHTSTTGLVASIILSTVDQKCMGVKTILVWVCVDVSVHFVNS